MQVGSEALVDDAPCLALAVRVIPAPEAFGKNNLGFSVHFQQPGEKRVDPGEVCSMATSTDADAPRGMEFLYSLHRLNVATSRARCVAAIVASPALLAPNCRTPEQMRLANPFCRFLGLARPAP